VAVGKFTGRLRLKARANTRLLFLAPDDLQRIESRAVVN